jgi:hypothetical protein
VNCALALRSRSEGREEGKESDRAIRSKEKHRQKPKKSSRVTMEGEKVSSLMVEFHILPNQKKAIAANKFKGIATDL